MLDLDREHECFHNSFRVVLPMSYSAKVECKIDFEYVAMSRSYKLFNLA